jgi:hypothetical protein
VNQKYVLVSNYPVEVKSSGSEPLPLQWRLGNAAGSLSSYLNKMRIERLDAMAETPILTFNMQPADAPNAEDKATVLAGCVDPISTPVFCHEIAEGNIITPLEFLYEDLDADGSKDRLYGWVPPTVGAKSETVDGATLNYSVVSVAGGIVGVIDDGTANAACNVALVAQDLEGFNKPQCVTGFEWERTRETMLRMAPVTVGSLTAYDSCEIQLAGMMTFAYEVPVNNANYSMLVSMGRPVIPLTAYSCDEPVAGKVEVSGDGGSTWTTLHAAGYSTLAGSAVNTLIGRVGANYSREIGACRTFNDNPDTAVVESMDVDGHMGIATCTTDADCDGNATLLDGLRCNENGYCAVECVYPNGVNPNVDGEPTVFVTSGVLLVRFIFDATTGDKYPDGMKIDQRTATPRFKTAIATSVQFIKVKLMP